MDRMSDRLDGHAERLDQVERRVSEADDEHNMLATAQKKVDTLLHTLQAKAEDLEARSRRNNVRIVGIAEPTRIDNMDRYVEQLLSDLRGRETFSDKFVVELAHCSVAPQLPVGAPQCPIIARLLKLQG
ncbi:hypothetical protein NDU88_002966 [Pleurodeles waltl]|uniref:Uncharacterized protein n=1 Tax=Pleurodeles waltl TaxID=8319 RepID=A0AAV7UB50_PLEWA|nr:hypothetical protein NDU88_002966 [Pleurodeles waltl]